MLWLLSCTPDAPVPAIPLRHPERMHVWLEYYEEGELDGRFEQAAELELNVNLALVRGRHGQETLRSACASALAHDVALTVWPLLPEDEGYWPNQGNHPVFSDWVDELLSWHPTDCPRLDAVAVDLEMPYERAAELQSLFTDGGDLPTALELLADGIDATAFEEARTSYDDLCTKVHSAGLHCNLTTLPMLADDTLDGDETLAMALWTPVEGIDWDRASIQVYRSLFDSWFTPLLADPTMRFGPGLVYSYAVGWRDTWEGIAAVDLGTTGAGIGVTAPLDGADALQADLAAARAAGITAQNLAVYSLEGLDEHDDAADWVAVPLPREPEADPAAAELRTFMSALDALPLP